MIFGSSLLRSSSLALFALVLLQSRQGLSQHLVLQSPVDYQVFQRTDGARGVIKIKGKWEKSPALPVEFEARLLAKNSDLRNSLTTNLPANQNTFSFDLAAPAGGWYQLEVRAGTNQPVVVEQVGVGEIFVIAGQSNSANHGEERQQIKSGMAASFNGKTWRMANDPQPGASGGGGSFIPPFADAMAERFGVPIGIVALGAGGTSVREWLPEGMPFPNSPTVLGNVKKLEDGTWVSNGALYARLINRTRELGPSGFRAILWHQGESDANQTDKTRTLDGKLYTQYLDQIIKQTQKECGWEMPWFIAQATYHTHEDTGSEDIRAAQASLWKSGVALQGPDTDKLAGDLRDNGGKGVHFSGKGLKAHAAAWVERVEPWLRDELKKKTDH